MQPSYSNGIYMQVIDQGCGDYIKKGTSVDVLVRFDEYNLSYMKLFFRIVFFPTIRYVLYAQSKP